MSSARTAELVARASYGRLVALLSLKTRDIAAAEDALADAFVAALTQWPTTGVPENPDAWLLTAARRRSIDAHRSASLRAGHADASAPDLFHDSPEAEISTFPDERLRLLLVCTHPAIEIEAQVPLMLQTVLGLSAEVIASACGVAPKTMGQRLWRAKTKIREAGISFEVPDRAVLTERLPAILEAIYAAFGTAWNDVAFAETRLRDLCEEAIFLGRLVVSLLPQNAEPKGLLALMLFAEARRQARRSATGEFVPLEQQDPRLWALHQIEEAEALLLSAAAQREVGPFQLEAAIQSAHIAGVRSGQLDVEAIVHLYDGLVALAPTLGSLVGRAAALIYANNAASALEQLDALHETQATAVRSYQPYWAVRADALRASGARTAAAEAYLRAIGLTEDDATRRFLSARLAAVQND